MSNPARAEYVAQDLVAAYPPHLSDHNKRVVFDLTMPPGAVHAGTLSCSRWEPIALPATIMRSAAQPDIRSLAGFFTYDPSPPGWTDWHVNFADRRLFGFYGTSLFAQDEMQVAEHPVLACLPRALAERGIEPYTVDGDRPTPILVAGVERRCAIATEPNPEQGRPNGLYGNRFAAASEDAVRQATLRLDPPTVSNILAMEAPKYGSGRYNVAQIDFVLDTACTGFTAAVAESQRIGGNGIRVEVNTGYWGCGAYGGNRVLMSLLQLVAAAAAGVDTLSFYAGDDSASFVVAHALYLELLPVDYPVATELLVQQIADRGFVWGVGNGT
jgi:hypothetical protein